MDREREKKNDRYSKERERESMRVTIKLFRK